MASWQAHFVQETDRTIGTGPLNCVRVTLLPLEVQILGK